MAKTTIQIQKATHRKIKEFIDGRIGGGSVGAFVDDLVSEFFRKNQKSFIKTKQKQAFEQPNPPSLS